MSMLGEVKRRIQMFFHRNQLSRELDEEIRLHLDLRREQRLAPINRCPRRSSQVRQHRPHQGEKAS